MRQKIEKLSTELVSALKEKELKVSSAESLTGGMISEIITSVPGASEVIECGVCSYSNRIKHEVLGVKNETLQEYTEYSVETAKEMAEGVRRLSGADIGISTTGIAGPSGALEGKPVGYVCIGISTAEKTYAKEFFFGSENSREVIRQLSAVNALALTIEEAGMQ